MTDRKFKRYWFGYAAGDAKLPFELNARDRTLKLEGEPVKHRLRGHDFDVLAYLLKHNLKEHRLVTYEELIREVWNDKESIDSTNVTASIAQIRKSLGDQPYMDNVPKEGYRLKEDVKIILERIDDPLPQTSIVLRKEAHKFDHGDFSELDTIHVHVDGGQAKALVRNIVRKFDRDGRPSKINEVEDSQPGPQRKDAPEDYIPHTPGDPDNEDLNYFSTHLFGNLAETKRELHRLLSDINGIRVKDIVIEAERIIGKFSDEHQRWSDAYIHDYPSLYSGDVGYEKWETKPIEIHYAVDIPRHGKWLNKPPLDLKILPDLTERLGIRVGGWFLFAEQDENKWAYRSNMFVKDAEEWQIEDCRRRLKAKIEEIGKKEGFGCEVKALVEHSIGIWKTPLKSYTEPISIIELSHWEAKYPDLRDFWVVTPNFLGDKKEPIEEAMIRNLRDRNVTYTYFLRSIADYNRLLSLAERLERDLGRHVNVYTKIRAVIVQRDASEESALKKVFEQSQHWHGCFIANPIPREDGVDDADGYMLERSNDPGEISGGKIMKYEQVKEIVKLLTPLIPDGRRLQGLSMSLSPQENKKVSGVTVVCIGLKSFPQLLSEVDDESVAGLLREYDLLVASVTSKFGGEVVKSIETGYFLKFNKQNEALVCAKEIHQSVNPTLKQRIAIDFGDVWRVMRAHGPDYCGRTITRCRALLKQTRYGEVTTTNWFADTLGQRFSSMLMQDGRQFDFEGSESRMWKLKG